MSDDAGFTLWLGRVCGGVAAVHGFLFDEIFGPTFLIELTETQRYVPNLKARDIAHAMHLTSCELGVAVL